MKPRTPPLWDLPTRVFHWSLPVLVCASWASAEFDAPQLHEYCGYAMLVLVAFRVVWGFVGSRHARFADFLRSPAATLRYLRGKAPAGAGHNPAGGWAVMLMLLLLASQAVTGLFNSDDVAFSGPLAHAVDEDIAGVLAGWHETNFWLLLALIALHLGAVMFYLLRRRQNLIGPMIGGGESARGGPQAPAWLALVVVALLAMLLWWLLSLVPQPQPFL